MEARVTTDQLNYLPQSELRRIEQQCHTVRLGEAVVLHFLRDEEELERYSRARVQALLDAIGTSGDTRLRDQLCGISRN